MRYYITQRPIVPGSYPTPDGNPVKNIHNYGCGHYCVEIGRNAWGYIEYEWPLTAGEAERWKLTPEGTTWYSVTVCSRKHGGGLTAFPSQIVQEARRPEDVSGSAEKTLFKTRYFCTQAEARRVMLVIQSLDITLERVRMSATQGEVKVLINGQHILNFGDEIVLCKSDAAPDNYYGKNIGGWQSIASDASFVLGLIWHPYDHVYRYSDLICSKLGIKPDEWIEGRQICRALL